MQATASGHWSQLLHCGSLIDYIIPTAATATTAAAATKRKHSRALMTGGLLGIPNGRLGGWPVQSTSDDERGGVSVWSVSSVYLNPAESQHG
jgi:hypothetical protein